MSPATRPRSNNFGLGLIGTSEANDVTNNKFVSNVNGIFITSPKRNVFRRNIIAGNPPVQVLQTFGKVIGADIQDRSPAGTNTFEGNYCLTYAGPGPSPCPKLDFEGEEQLSQYVAPRKLSAPAWHENPVVREDPITRLLSNGPARLMNALFHFARPPRP